jgi:hypothetical protein
MKPIFTAKDFDFGTFPTLANQACDQANNKLAKLIESWPVVYGWIDSNTWSGRHTDNTHIARLAFIELIQPCKHEPVYELDKFVSSTSISPGKVGWTYWDEKKWKCAKCGVELVAEWKAK